MQCFVFVEKIVSTVLPFFENNIYKVLNIYQMIQICQGFQPNFKSFMKSLVGYISDKLADENVTGRDFSTFFTWPLSHKPLCVSIWNSHPAILNVLIQFRSSCYQEINIQKKKFYSLGTSISNEETMCSGFSYKLIFPASTYSNLNYLPF